MAVCLDHPPDLYPVHEARVRCLLYTEDAAKEAV
jgi:hypothetical protein